MTHEDVEPELEADDPASTNVTVRVEPGTNVTVIVAAAQPSLSRSVPPGSRMTHCRNGSRTQTRYDPPPGSLFALAITVALVAKYPESVVAVFGGMFKAVTDAATQVADLLAANVHSGHQRPGSPERARAQLRCPELGRWWSESSA
jgi:hypothetical protein